MTENIHASFEPVERNGETIFVHKTKPVWVVGYEAHENDKSA
jgi:hypothetical protein